jgi:chromosome segregation ATPase
MANTNNKTAAEAVKAVAVESSTVAVAAPATNSAELEVQVNQLTADLRAANRTITNLEGQLDAARSENGELAGELNEVRAELSESQEMVGDLQERLSKAAAIQAQSDSVIVSDGISHYKVLAPKFKHKHVEYTSEQLRDNEALVQELVEARVGFLQKIETEK